MHTIGLEIIHTMKTIIYEQLQSLRFDKTFKSTIWSKNNDGTYNISYKCKEYAVPNATGTDLKPGTGVWVKIPGGIFRNMHICGINCKN